MKMLLQRVHYVPNKLESGVLYVSEDFDIATHLCACGCGSKVITPLGPTEWSFEDSPNGPTLDPSIGSWQLPCQSHYWIRDGKIIWADRWSMEEILEGRKRENMRRMVYYDSLNAEKKMIHRIFDWLKNKFR